MKVRFFIYTGLFLAALGVYYFGQYQTEQSRNTAETKNNSEEISSSQAAPQTVAKRKKSSPARSSDTVTHIPSLGLGTPKMDPIQAFFLELANLREWGAEERANVYVSDAAEANEPEFKLTWSTEVTVPGWENYGAIRMIYIVTSVATSGDTSGPPSLFFYFQAQAQAKDAEGMMGIAAQSGRIDSLRTKNDRFWVTSNIYADPFTKTYSNLLASVPTMEEFQSQLYFVDPALYELTAPIEVNWTLESQSFDPWGR